MFVYDLLVVSLISTLNVGTRLLYGWTGLKHDDSSQKEFPKHQVEARNSNLNQQGREALDMILAYGGNVEAVMLEMFDCGLCFSNVTESNRTICRVWQWALRRGHLRSAEKLLNLGIDLEMIIDLKLTFNDISTTALGIASYHSYPDLFDLLLHKGANPNASIHQTPWQTPINLGSCAARQTKDAGKKNAWLVILSKLISHGADISQFDNEGDSLLSIAVRDSGNEEIVSMLL